MKMSTVTFVVSNTDYKNCPKDERPEFAFIGRSNVGKSSLINMLTGQKKLAKTSSTPGKTQLINHFIVNDQWYLVDLPGYGYAKVSKNQRNQWQKFISQYLLHRENLISIFVLIDARLEPQTIDLDFLTWCGKNNIPFAMIFTKMDKLSSAELQRNITKYQSELLKSWEEVPPFFVTSSTTSFGKENVLEYINDVLVALKQGK
ncbi:MAG: YihA family ribosome biogenesis GTP-binding protein [Flavobacteriia bacterium]|jgi:GTP-binding protein|nr:YihA family ribosome biogenesis GTP-binding protein [Flavobacteriia bacterium]NBV67250.1 YihA family ribosome biogenesis GTP-binding protein [Flavobacteriia bacterium]NBY41165.1 YihA family ribosome biogenesis GTP-binding protein [Flavobacteriia bacterium]